jgi:cell division protein FtsB
MLGLAFVAAVIGFVLAVAFWFQGQSAAGVVKALRQEADAARKEAETARAELKRTTDELKARSAQLVESREKLTETRKKAQEAKGGRSQSRGAREAELEEDLAHARKVTGEAHAAEAAARRELAASKVAEAQAKAELAAAQAKIRELSSRPAPVAAAAPVAPPSHDAEAQRMQLEAARSELERQVQAAERNGREAKRREQELREEIKKHKGRAETNNRVYLVTKGELELTKERLALAERRLWQAGIPLAPPPSKERPKATGPAAAEKPHEESAPEAEAVAAPALEAAQSAPPQPGEPVSAGESAASAPEERTPIPAEDPPPGGVAPIRRRPENGAEKS